jgi:hypothetical protein
MKELIKRILAVIMIIFTLWAVVSYGEILTKNVRENPQYNKWNLFIFTEELAQK